MGTLVLDSKYAGYTFDSTYLRIKKEIYNDFEKHIHKSPVKKKVVFSGILFVEFNGVIRNLKTEGLYAKIVEHFEVYFNKQDTDEPLIFGYVEENGNKVYYSFSELVEKEKTKTKVEIFVKNDKKGEKEIELYEIKKIEGKDLDVRLAQEKSKNTLFFNIHKKSEYRNVMVNIESLEETSEFKKYIHKPNDSRNTTRYEFMLCEDKCIIDSFNPKDYKNKKIDEVSVYFHNSDEKNSVPLLIEIKTNLRASIENAYFELTDIYEVDQELSYINEHKYVYRKQRSKTYIKKYTKSKQPEKLTEKLSEIYNNSQFSYKIYDILGIDNSTLVGAVSGTFGTIGAIGTGVGGFFIYKNSDLVLGFLRSLFKKF